MVADRIDWIEPHTPRRLKSRRITLRRNGSGAALLVIIGLTGCGSPGTDAPRSPLNVNGSATMSAAATPSTSTSGESTGLPPMKRFRIGGEAYGPVQDCRIDGTAVTCTASWDDPYQTDTYTGGFTGTLSGLEMTGITTSSQTGHDATDPDCQWQMETTAPITYTFSPQGTVTARSGPGQWRKTNSGSCSGTESGTDTGEAESGPTQWTVIEQQGPSLNLVPPVHVPMPARLHPFRFARHLRSAYRLQATLTWENAGRFLQPCGELSGENSPLSYRMKTPGCSHN